MKGSSNIRFENEWFIWVKSFQWIIDSVHTTCLNILFTKHADFILVTQIFRVTSEKVKYAVRFIWTTLMRFNILDPNNPLTL